MANTYHETTSDYSSLIGSRSRSNSMDILNETNADGLNPFRRTSHRMKASKLPNIITAVTENNSSSATPKPPKSPQLHRSFISDQKLSKRKVPPMTFEKLDPQNSSMESEATQTSCNDSQSQSSQTKLCSILPIATNSITNTTTSSLNNSKTSGHGSEQSYNLDKELSTDSLTPSVSLNSRHTSGNSNDIRSGNTNSHEILPLKMDRLKFLRDLDQLSQRVQRTEEILRKGRDDPLPSELPSSLQNNKDINRFKSTINKSPLQMRKMEMSQSNPVTNQKFAENNNKDISEKTNINLTIAAVENNNNNKNNQTVAESYHKNGKESYSLSHDRNQNQNFCVAVENKNIKNNNDNCEETIEKSNEAIENENEPNKKLNMNSIVQNFEKLNAKSTGKIVVFPVKNQANKSYSVPSSISKANQRNPNQSKISSQPGNKIFNSAHNKDTDIIQEKHKDNYQFRNVQNNLNYSNNNVSTFAQQKAPILSSKTIPLNTSSQEILLNKTKDNVIHRNPNKNVENSPSSNKCQVETQSEIEKQNAQLSLKTQNSFLELGKQEQRTNNHIKSNQVLTSTINNNCNHFIPKVGGNSLRDTFDCKTSKTIQNSTTDSQTTKSKWTVDTSYLNSKNNKIIDNTNNSKSNTPNNRKQNFLEKTSSFSPISSPSSIRKHKTVKVPYLSGEAQKTSELFSWQTEKGMPQGLLNFSFSRRSILTYFVPKKLSKTLFLMQKSPTSTNTKLKLSQSLPPSSSTPQKIPDCIHPTFKPKTTQIDDLLTIIEKKSDDDQALSKINSNKNNLGFETKTPPMRIKNLKNNKKNIKMPQKEIESNSQSDVFEDVQDTKKNTSILTEDENNKINNNNNTVNTSSSLDKSRTESTTSTSSNAKNYEIKMPYLDNKVKNEKIKDKNFARKDSLFDPNSSPCGKIVKQAPKKQIFKSRSVHETRYDDIREDSNNAIRAMLKDL